MESQVATNQASKSPKQSLPPSVSSNEKLVKIACTECRRQKVKCNANVEVPCSRCNRVRTYCEIVAPLKRTSKRKFLDNQQTSLPKRRLEMAMTPTNTISPNSQDPGNIGIPTPQAVPNTPISIGTITAGGHPTSTSSHSPAPTHHSQNHSVIMGIGLENSVMPRTAMGLEELGMAAEIVRGDTANAGGESGKGYVRPSGRVLDGICVDGKTVEDVFKLYFAHYSPILPILDPAIHPDAYYTQLPFLFWCIVAVGSRRYTQDPTIFHSVAQRVLEIASINVASRPMSVAVVQALLLLLTWGYWDRLSSKTGFPLSGLVIHMSMHMGLHNPLSGRDFLATRMKLSDDERRRRGELWAHCVLVYQRACLRIGFAPLNVPRPNLSKSMQQSLKSTGSTFDLDFEVSLHDLLARASTALTENGLKFESIHQERGMCIILKIFEDQLTDLESKASPLQDIDKLYLSIGRLSILTMYHFQSPENIDLTCRTRMYITASEVIDRLVTIDKNTQLVSYSTTYICLGVVLASVILLRFLKGSFAKYIDYDSCKASFFSGLTLLKTLSVENNDGPARFAMGLGQIWVGDQMFKMPDGSRNEELRVRSRLAMSVVYDTIWWAQDTDGYPHRPGCPHERLATLGENGDAAREIGVPEQSASTILPLAPFEYCSSFDDQIPFDLGWALTDDVFFASWQGGTSFTS